MYIPPHSHFIRRHCEQIKHRYENALDPTLKKNAKWTDDEVRILKVRQQLHGNCWKTISGFLPGRTEQNVKNKWYNMKTSEKKAVEQRQSEEQHSQHQPMHDSAVVVQSETLNGDANARSQVSNSVPLYALI